MNSELAKLRQHYESLPSKVRTRATAQSLLRAIQIAEKAMDDLSTSRQLCDAIRDSETDLRNKLARVTKEGE